MLSILSYFLLFLGILLNSLMSILSFNHFDFSLMLKKVDENNKQGRMHKSKFRRQCVYNIIITAVYLEYEDSWFFLVFSVFYVLAPTGAQRMLMVVYLCLSVKFNLV